MRLLVRTWNLSHGRTIPGRRSLKLERMVRLVAEDGPDVVCLQEVPVWALGQLERWSAMRAFGAVTMPALAGSLARRLTALDPRHIRSALTGQANALLVSSGLRVEGGPWTLTLNPPAFRRREAERLGLARRDRLAWGRNRRVVQAVRVVWQEGSAVVVNLHATSNPDRRLADAEVLRAASFAETIARPGEPVLLCGDLNVEAGHSSALAELGARGFSAAGPGIDHILVRGLALVRGPEPWPEARRQVGGRLLSDHAPVEVEMMGL